MANRLRGRCGYPEDDPFRVTFHPDKLKSPIWWNKPSRVFVCSMGDLFHERVNFRGEEIRMIFGSMLIAHDSTFLLLTKRPERMKQAMDDIFLRDGREIPKNLWLGVSAENQARADERIPILLQIPAAVRFVSVEPMLGPVDLRRAFGTNGPRQTYIEQLDWVICGGETGPGARMMESDWARSLREQCSSSGSAFFFKQHGDAWCKDFGVNPKYRENRELDGRTWDEYPEVKP